ncbi:hypothetical protein [Prevotella sp.]
MKKIKNRIYTPPMIEIISFHSDFSLLGGSNSEVVTSGTSIEDPTEDKDDTNLIPLAKTNFFTEEEA